MHKKILSTTIKPEIFEMIEEAARENKITRSEVTRMILEIIRYIPPDRFRKNSPIMEFLINNKEETKQ